MSANIDIIQQEKDNVVLLPVDAVKKFGDKSVVFVKVAGSEKPEKREVVTGLTDGDNVEITTGLSGTETVVVYKQAYAVQQNNQTVNPFMPQRPRMGGGRRN